MNIHAYKWYEFVCVNGLFFGTLEQMSDLIQYVSEGPSMPTVYQQKHRCLCWYDIAPCAVHIRIRLFTVAWARLYPYFICERRVHLS